MPTVHLGLHKPTHTPLLALKYTHARAHTLTQLHMHAHTDTQTTYTHTHGQTWIAKPTSSSSCADVATPWKAAITWLLSFGWRRKPLLPSAAYLFVSPFSSFPSSSICLDILFPALPSSIPLCDGHSFFLSSVRPSIYPSVYPSVCPCVRLSVCPSARVFVCTFFLSQTTGLTLNRRRL